MVVYDRKKGFLEKRGHLRLSSTPVKTLFGNTGPVSVGIDCIESPVKSSVGVAFKTDEEKQVICDEHWFAKRRTLKKGEDSRLTTSTGGLVTEITFSEVNATVAQGTSTGRVGMLLFSRTSLGFGLYPREELSAQTKFPQRSKYYPSQSSKTLLKHFF